MQITNFYKPVHTQLCFILKYDNEKEHYITHVPTNLSIKKMMDSLNTITELKVNKVKISQRTDSDIFLNITYFKNTSHGPTSTRIKPYWVEGVANLSAVNDELNSCHLISNFIEIEIDSETLRTESKEVIVNKLNELIDKYVYLPVMEDYLKGEADWGETFTGCEYINAERYPSHSVKRKYIHRVNMRNKAIWSTEDYKLAGYEFELFNAKLLTPNLLGNSSRYYNYLIHEKIKSLFYYAHMYKSEINHRLSMKFELGPFVHFWLSPIENVDIIYDGETNTETIVWTTNLVLANEPPVKDKVKLYDRYFEVLEEKFRTLLEQRHYFILQSIEKLIESDIEEKQLGYIANNLINDINNGVYGNVESD